MLSFICVLWCMLGTYYDVWCSTPLGTSSSTMCGETSETLLFLTTKKENTKENWWWRVVSLVCTRNPDARKEENTNWRIATPTGNSKTKQFVSSYRCIQCCGACATFVYVDVIFRMKKNFKFITLFWLFMVKNRTFLQFHKFFIFSNEWRSYFVCYNCARNVYVE